LYPNYIHDAIPICIFLPIIDKMIVKSHSIIKKEEEGRGNEMMQQFISFDKMITPTIIKILFWIGVALSGLFAIILIFTGLGQMFSDFGDGFYGFLMVLLGVAYFVIGTLMSKIYCELLIVVFKMQEALSSIDRKLESKETIVN